jgi:tripartite-type tricarboxylate transporter receptor subunit TctC
LPQNMRRMSAMLRSRNKATLFCLTIFLCAMIVFVALIGAAEYPRRPISLICPWAAGGGTDRVARMVAALLNEELGKPVTVINRTGGGGAVGHTAGATARPDGYTITMITVELTMMHWLGLAKVNYGDYEPVAQLNLDPAAINVRADAPWKDVRELHEFILANPGQLKASGTGKGGSWDLARAGWLKAAGISVNGVPWVPSTGAAPALRELIAGGIDIVTCSLPEAVSLIDAKKVKVLAIMADDRNPMFPEVRTLKEQGIDWSMGAWRGIGVPKNTPDDVVNRLEAALEKIAHSETFIDFMDKNGFGVKYRSAGEFGAFLAESDQVMGQLMRESGIVK